MRLGNSLRLPLLFACYMCLLWPSFAVLRAQTFNLQTDREPVTSLDGLWRFHTGDNPAWASPNFDDSKWPLLRSGESWSVQGYPGYSGYAWYRFAVQVPGDGKPVSLLLPYVSSGYQVYANGKLIGSAGSATPTRDPIAMAIPKTFRLPDEGAGPQTIQIALRIWEYKRPLNFFHLGGIFLGAGAFGDPAWLNIRRQYARKGFALASVNDYANCLLETFVGLTVLVLFLLRREDGEYLWFSILLLADAANTATVMPVLGYSIPFFLDWLLIYITWSLSWIAALAFFSIVLNVRRSFWWWAACIVVAAIPLGVVILYFQGPESIASHAMIVVCLLPASLWIMVTLAIGALRKDNSARLLLVPAMLYYGVAIIEYIVGITWQLGWQRILQRIDIPLLQQPFPLSTGDVIGYIFIMALLIFLVRRFSVARQEEARLSTEMEAARSIQSMLVPATAPSTPGFTVESVYLPASEVGGDFFQTLSGEDGSLLIVMGDVSGKGLKAAMTVSTIVGALRNESSHRPGEILTHLNRVLHGQITGFATCCITRISADGEMAIANAGHLSPYRNGEELNVGGGLPLGVVADGSYEETGYQLALGDRLVFMSDGVIEARNKDGALYGFERTQQISNRSAAAIAKTAKQFGQEDDITVVTVERSARAVHAI